MNKKLQSTFKQRVFYLFVFIFIATSVFIFYLSLNNADNSLSQSTKIGDMVANFLHFFRINVDTTSDVYQSFIRKGIGHFGLFFVFSLFGTISLTCLKQNRFIKVKCFAFVLLYGIFIAILSEILQMIPENREPSYKDVLIDLAGFLCPLIIFIIFELFRYFKYKNAENLI